MESNLTFHCLFRSRQFLNGGYRNTTSKKMRKRRITYMAAVYVSVSKDKQV